MYATPLALTGSNVLLGQGSSLTVIDISSAANPSRIGSTDIGDIIQSVSVNGSTAYAAAGNSGFAAVSLSNPAKPQVSSFNTAGLAYDIAASGSTLCVADGPKGLAVYNIASPLAPVLQGTYTSQGSVTDVVLSGTTAYILDDQLGLQIINTSTRTLIGALNRIEFGQAIAIVGTKSIHYRQAWRVVYSQYRYTGNAVAVEPNQASGRRGTSDSGFRQLRLYQLANPASKL